LIKSSLRKIAVDISGDPKIVDNFYLSEWFIVIVVGAIVFPFVLIKKIENLRIFAFVGVVGILVFIIGVVAIYITNTIDGY
jgi:amino acid permease